MPPLLQKARVMVKTSNLWKPQVSRRPRLTPRMTLRKRLMPREWPVRFHCLDNAWPRASPLRKGEALCFVRPVFSLKILTQFEAIHDNYRTQSGSAGSLQTTDEEVMAELPAKLSLRSLATAPGSVCELHLGAIIKLHHYLGPPHLDITALPP